MRLLTTCALLLGLMAGVEPAAAQTAPLAEHHAGPPRPEALPRRLAPGTRSGLALPEARPLRAASATGLEVIDLEATNTQVHGISDDGEIIVGRRLWHPLHPDLEGALIRWAPWSGPMPIGGTSGGSGRPVVSGPGDTIFGTLEPDPGEPWSYVAARWFPSTFGWEFWDTLYDLDHVPTPPEDESTEVTGLSRNGLHLVGMHYPNGLWRPQPFHWTEEGGQGWRALSLPDEEAAWVVPYAASDDGHLIAGGSNRPPQSAIFGIRWVGGQTEWILDAEGEHVGEVLACNSDCSVMVGNSVGNSETESVLAYRWTEGGGVHYLQPFEGAPEASRYWAGDVSEDGSVVVGTYAYRILVEGQELTILDGFIWFDDGEGGTMHRLRTWLGYHGIDAFDGWYHFYPQAITPDARFIAGSGDVVEGEHLVMQSWRLELPPASPHCLVSAEPIFENPVVGLPSTREAVVTNAGTGPCELSGVLVSGDDAFSAALAPRTLLPGAQARAEVTFSADDLDLHEAELTFESPQGDFSIPLSAAALPPPLAGLEADELLVEMEEGVQTLPVALRNEAAPGAADLEFALASIASEDSDLEAVSVEPASGAVAPGSEATLSVSVDPSGLAPGTYTYTVTLATNDPEQTELALSVVIAGATSAEEITPAAFALLPAFPNPFEGATTLAFELPEAGHALLEVLDLAGRRVAVVLDEPLLGGRHEVRWQAGGLASGTYLVRLRVGEASQTLRATLLR